jgi:hypothetical protein
MKSRSLKVYPRLDREYKSKNSLDFQNCRSNIFLTRPNDIWIKMSSWLAFLVIGIFVGIAAFVVDLLVNHLMMWKWKITEIVFNY